MKQKMITVELGRGRWEYIIQTLDDLEEESCADFTYIKNKIKRAL